MNRPRSNNSLAPDNVLSRMLPGKTYGAYVLAAKFHVPTARIWPVLDLMVTRGMLEMGAAQPGTIGFRRAKEAPAFEQEQVLTSIATPPVLVTLKGTLTGYDSEIARRVELCMLARGTR